MERGRGKVAFLGALAVPWLAGCSLLGLGPDFDGAFPEPSILATYRAGSASIALADGPTIELDQVAADSSLEATFGASVRWFGADGWHVRFNGSGEPGPFGGVPAYLTLDRVSGGEHRTSMDPTRCIVDVEVADKSAIRGTATCKGVEWYDALDQPFGFGPEGPEPLDEPPFDAEIWFEAKP
jgi:hypothetical protein